MLTKTEPLPMTGSARDSLIAIAVLWVLFAITVAFRFAGRLRGIGIGFDDVLSACALVSTFSGMAVVDLSLTTPKIMSASTIGMNAVVFTIGVGWDLDPESPVFPQCKLIATKRTRWYRVLTASSDEQPTCHYADNLCLHAGLHLVPHSP